MERLLVIDVTRAGDGTASGELKAALLAPRPPSTVLQVHQETADQLRVVDGSGTPLAAETPSEIAAIVAAFAPEVVLYRPVPKTPMLHRLAMELLSRTTVPLALWIVDDWPAALAVEDPEQAALMDLDLRYLVDRSDVRFSIAAAMSAAFEARYGRPFIPVANGIDPADWPPPHLGRSGETRLRYAGSLADNMTLDSVLLVADVVEQLAAAGLEVVFEIRTQPYWYARVAERVRDLAHTKLTTSDLSPAAYRAWLADADVLLIAYNFDDRSQTYIRYSLANKLPECLASGAAVLAVGPEGVATIDTLAALDVGVRITSPDPAAVASAIRGLAGSPARRLELGRRAQSLAFEAFDIAATRSRFDAAIERVTAAHAAQDFPRELGVHVDETRVIARLLHERRGAAHVMLDVGAHGGSSAAPFAGAGWSVHCFEPEPERRAALEARFAANSRVRVDPRAVSDAPATGATFFTSPESTGISTLHAFRASHQATGTVDVTTIGAVVAERRLRHVDFLKVDVEGLDFAVLRGVPWATLSPDVIECEFEDRKTRLLGHAWRDIAVYLRDRGYAVYVSEWHPVIRYGIRHDWRRVIPFTDNLELDPAAWGNLLAFRTDPGLATLRRAFQTTMARGAGTRLPARWATPSGGRGRVRRVLRRIPGMSAMVRAARSRRGGSRSA